MRWLPEIDVQGRLVKVPLSGISLHGFRQALLHLDDKNKLHGRLAATWRQDPALAFWMLVSIGSGDPASETSGQDAAERITGVLYDLFEPVLAVYLAELPHRRGISRKKSVQFADLAANTVTRIADQSETANRENSSPGLGNPGLGNSLLLEILTDWDEWVSLSVENTSTENNGSALDAIRAWLTGCLKGTHSQATSHLPQESVAGTLSGLEEETNAGGGTSDKLDPRRFRRQWLAVSRSAEDDLATLARRMLRLRELESDFFNALETAKLQAMKEFAYGAGHEINNPLANISARAQTLLFQESDPQRRRALTSISAQAFRAHEMIADTMLFARPPQLQREPSDLSAIVREVVADLSPQAIAQESELVFSSGSQETDFSTPISVDPLQIKVALLALVRNSLEALGTGGGVEIGLIRRLDGPNAWVEISVQDDGPGIPAEVIPHIFDPFYSGREAGRGLGFGLSKCWRIVTDHGGSVVFESGRGRGCCFTIHLPLPKEFVERVEKPL